jgi:DHA1 family multidrug resistance protein-like MFS transporter
MGSIRNSRQVNESHSCIFTLTASNSGPALGPLISGFSVTAKNWHWSLWEILWLSGPVFVSLMFFLPETSSSNILLRRAERLRKITGNQNLKSQSEIDQSKLTVNEVVVGNLWRPFQINFQDPAVLFTSVYVALIYGIYYSFFEVFPIVYGAGGYGMNLGQLGLVFLCILVAVLIAIPAYWSYLYWVANPEILTKGLPPPEKRLIPAIYASILAPVGLFIFAWTGNHPDRNPWIAPTIGISVYTIGIFLMLQ